MTTWDDRIDQALAGHSNPFASREELRGQWRGIGSTKDGEARNRTAAYLKLQRSQCVIPKVTGDCICGCDKLVINCYIYNAGTDTILVVGTECIKKFIPKENRGKRCFRCNKRCHGDYCAECQPTPGSREKACIYDTPDGIGYGERTYLDVTPGDIRGNARELGARYDTGSNRWYFDESLPKAKQIALTNRFNIVERI